MNKLDWNKERYRTRDRLIEYNFNIYPAVPHTAGLPLIYPWENIAIKQLKAQFIEIVRSNGYVGDETELWTRFSDGTIKTSTLNNFPIQGSEKNLYLDVETGILYYFKKTPLLINTDLAEQIGAFISGTDKQNDESIMTYMYIPVRALLEENTLISGGEP